MGTLDIIARAWSFYRSQPLMNTIVFFLLFLPIAILDLFSWLFPMSDGIGEFMQANASLGVAILGAGVLLPIILIVCLIWADAAIILVGRKLIEKVAGRNRTSFREILGDARKFILPLICTGILMTCGVLLWSLLFIVPGIIYAIRTFFYEVIVVIEGKSYRESLRRSKEIVRGQMGRASLTLIALFLCLFLPIGLLGTLLQSVNERRLLIAGILALDGLRSIAYALFLLCLVILFGELRKRPTEVRPAVPPSNERR